MVNLLIAGKVDHLNFGDVLMVAFYARYAKECGINVKVAECSSSLLEQVRAFNKDVECIKVSEIDEAIDFCVFTGGGYFAHNYINGYKWCSRWEGDGYFIALKEKLLDKNIPYIINSVEVGPIYRKTTRKHVAAILAGASHVVLRNKGSKKFASEVLGIQKAECGPDMVLSELPRFSEVYQLRSPQEKGCIGIHVTDKLTASNLHKVGYEKMLCEFIKNNSSNKIKKVVLFSDNEETANLDEAFERIDKKIRKHVPVVVERYSGVDSLIKLLSRIDLAVTTKLHVGVSVISLGGRALCFSDTPKSMRFYKELDLSKCHSGFYFSTTSRKQRKLYNVWNKEEGFLTHAQVTGHYQNSFYKLLDEKVESEII